MDGKGIGVAVAVIVAVAAVAAGAPAACVAVDAADIQPDHPLYRLERAGESIRHAFSGGVAWERDRADERLAEYEHMCAKGRAREFEGLLAEYQGHVQRLYGLTRENTFNLVMAMIEKHDEVLENLLALVPPEARPAIERAMLVKERCKEALENRFPLCWENYCRHREQAMQEYLRWVLRVKWR